MSTRLIKGVYPNDNYKFILKRYFSKYAEQDIYYLVKINTTYYIILNLRSVCQYGRSYSTTCYHEIKKYWKVLYKKPGDW